MEPREVAALEPAEAGKTRYIRVKLDSGAVPAALQHERSLPGRMHVKVTVR